MDDDHEVKLTSDLVTLITKMEVSARIRFDGGLVRPLRKRGFEFVHEVFGNPTSVLLIEWIEPTEDVSFRKAYAILSLGDREVRIVVDCYEDGSLLLSGA